MTTKSEDKVTIIIPVYNVEKYLDKCIDSIRKQTYKNLEIILINDGSTDNSKKICEENKKSDKRIQLITQENSGVSSARNKGLNTATGKYILFLDSDDYIENNYVQNMVEEIVGNQLVICGYYEEYKNKLISIEVESKVLDGKSILNKISNSSMGGYLWNKLFVRKIIKDNNILFDSDIHMCEDLLFVCKYLQNCDKVKTINKKYYHYRMRKSSMVWNKNSKKYNSIVIAYKRINELYKKNNINNILLKKSLLNEIYTNRMKRKNDLLLEIFGKNESDIFFEIIKNKDISIKEKTKLVFNKICITIYFIYMKRKIKKYGLYE